MAYNFDEIVPRENTDCLKYDDRLSRFGNAHVQPLWVADMDFRVPPYITEEFHKIADHGIYGYQIKTEKYYSAIGHWFQRRHGYIVPSDGIFFTPGVVAALSYVIQSLTQKGDKILVQTPVYYPFFSVVTQNERQLLTNQLVESNNLYSIDFDDFEAKAREASLFILCSPHNPAGRVWSKNELDRMAEICLRNKVIIVADEIHNDLVFDPHQHIPMASISPEIDNICVTCHAPSKTFNLAGLSTAYAFTSNKNYQQILRKYLSNLHVDALNPFGLNAMVTAYNEAEEWLNELMRYLKSNHEFVLQFIKKELPQVKVSPLEATYLLWLDFRSLQLSDKELKAFIIEKAQLGLNDGPVFGKGGSGFQRMNIACPQSELAKALNSLKKAML